MTNSLNVLSDEKSWYRDGLPFQCTGCGQCCTGAPGYVWIEDSEIEAIAAHLGISVKEMHQKYLRFVNGRYSLREDARTFDCVFLRDKKCQIYEQRPKQCRTFPWWPENLKSRAHWRSLEGYCEGVSQKDAPVTAYPEIEEARKDPGL